MRIKRTHFENHVRDDSHDARIKGFLADRPGEGHRYGTIAKSLGLEWHVALHALQALVINDPDVIEYWPLARTPGASLSAKHRATRLFRLAPERKIIDAHPWRTGEVVTAVLTDLLADGPKSKRALYQAVRERLVHLDERIVDRCMASMQVQRLGTSKSSTRYALAEVSRSGSALAGRRKPLADGSDAPGEGDFGA